MQKYLSKGISGVVLFLLGASLVACSPNEEVAPNPLVVNPPVEVPFDINTLSDTYAAIAPYEFRFKWGPYNTHDPSIIKEGSYFYCYSTDAGFGTTVPAGIQVRKSKDLINWEYVGTAFNDLPQQGADFIKQNGGTPFNSLWAPYILKVNNEFRLYYSLSSPTPRLSVIGLATAASPEGPWTEKGLVVTSLNNSIIQTNAIDPTVVVDNSGNHTFYYGSAWDGIYTLKLNPATGLAALHNDKGTRVAQRGFTGNKINGNIEGPEIIYQPELKKYYLFISYDWLETKYNVRVGRSDFPEGPFYDFNGKDINSTEDHGPMILAPYQFAGHSGWQGVAHPAVFADNGQYYMAHQGRPGENKFFMVLHVRKIYWTKDGWPIVSPERFSGTEQTTIPDSELVGIWEQITLSYQVVPGYAEEQVSPDFQTSIPLELKADGTLNNDAASKWTYKAPWLELNWSNGKTDNVYVERGRDWENKKPCLVFTGLNTAGTAIWGRK
ncbi:arabinan endo-1,5-alpha-L-arabinosidase [Adhaeribacter arboris]|uniref:Arabinan endo-1,5-alpha-L-arabinosidase n=1 Tax=Adhaeribacter arboris TaxID=2072846 RepID=A0A2T2YJS0_9BACT|nr:arabinan endo-1,5-alpha-L-arabinosidase [Adhaeribacter arboris]PSR55751.1 arabinan endo-1,5-alpha-L-arabinosidase [Adhaeribacter arboris]